MDFFNRNYNFVMEITILPLFQKLKFLGSYSLVLIGWVDPKVNGLDL